MNSPVRVLVVEDNTEIRELVTEILEDTGYTVTSVADSPGALSVLSARAVDLLVVDLHLGDASGIEVARRAHRELPDLPILITTGLLDADQGDIAELRAEIIEKPFVASELVSKVLAMQEQRS